MVDPDSDIIFRKGTPFGDDAKQNIPTHTDTTDAGGC